ncbi:conserved hypothetical protein [Prochlorococcus marinus subsp. pastoris str. CCMP1986]|uniref:Haloacid dehalogenase-like hydrolase n=1 Tax=Prochlorococcus marinus subsp. pastoris (strain CCMP1986 / NIES-2087 / MED4) TaxID=59919 RepID=Q7V0L9_PROMP|nr:hypothetical protein [Prochlorococcus marinus]KGF87200.1 hypothetical protein PROCH_0787 [Prochlorococcus marinus str. EQPAC1]CAE19696.1 conserved hypothetical protein [Prochlorococcus marinus subsp. pastoris str. CCMP1986]
MKKLGLDFDNTLIDYDEVFYKLALEKNLIPQSINKDKKSVRKFFIDNNIEDEFIKLQGEVYGLKVLEAKQSFGMFEALKSLKNDNFELIIVSHKTKYPYSGKKYDLHKAASNWLEVNKFYDEDGLAMKRENVYFEVTKEDKISRIEELDISFYIDDLQSILEMIRPSIKRILYNPKFKEKIDKDFYLLENWKDLKYLIEEIS